MATNGAFGGFKSFAQQRQEIIDQLTQQRLASAETGRRAFTSQQTLGGRLAALGSQIGEGAFAIAAPSAEEAADKRLAPQAEKIRAEEGFINQSLGTSDYKAMDKIIDAAERSGKVSPQVMEGLARRREEAYARDIAIELRERGLNLQQLNMMNNIIGRAGPDFWKQVDPNMTDEKAQALAAQGRRYLEGMIAVNQYKASGSGGTPGREAESLDINLAKQELDRRFSNMLGPLDNAVYGMSETDQVKWARVIEDEARHRAKKDQRKSLAAHRQDTIAAMFDPEKGVFAIDEGSIFDSLQVREENLDNVFLHVKRSKKQDNAGAGVRGKPSDIKQAQEEGIIDLSR